MRCDLKGSPVKNVRIMQLSVRDANPIHSKFYPTTRGILLANILPISHSSRQTHLNKI